MNLDDAIKHCEEIAMDKTNLAQTLWDSKEKARCEECAEEHNQLAQWLIELKMLKTEQQSSGSENPNNCEMRDATPEEREAIEKYIKSISKPTGVKFGSLEQEPSGDLISRQAVLAEIFKKPAWHNSDGSYYHADDIRDAVNSVKPQVQTGHWIFDEILDKHYYCSECKSMGVDYWDFCPYCGAKMVEPQETKPEISSFYGLRSYVGERSKE